MAEKGKKRFPAAGESKPSKKTVKRKTAVKKASGTSSKKTKSKE